MRKGLRNKYLRAFPGRSIPAASPGLESLEFHEGYLGKVLLEEKLLPSGKNVQTKNAFSGKNLSARFYCKGAYSALSSHPGYSQRVIVKFGIFRSKESVTRKYLHYIGREGAAEFGEKTTFFSNEEGTLSKDSALEVTKTWKKDRHHIRVILSPERGLELNMQKFTKDFIQALEADLQASFQYIATLHYDTGKPHAHILIRGKKGGGGDLVIPREYIKRGARKRAEELATKALGRRSVQDIQNEQERQVTAKRFTQIDSWILSEMGENRLVVTRAGGEAGRSQRELKRLALIAKRLRVLKSLGLVAEEKKYHYRISRELKEKLIELSEKADIYRSMQREMGEYLGTKTHYFCKNSGGIPLRIGVVVRKGVLSEERMQSYAIVASLYGENLHLPILFLDKEQSIKEGDFVQVGARERKSVTASDRALAAYRDRVGEQFREEDFFKFSLHYIENKAKRDHQQGKISDKELLHILKNANALANRRLLRVRARIKTLQKEKIIKTSGQEVLIPSHLIASLQAKAKPGAKYYPEIKFLFRGELSSLVESDKETFLETLDEKRLCGLAGSEARQAVVLRKKYLLSREYRRGRGRKK